jgi:hypothetical protein
LAAGHKTFVYAISSPPKAKKGERLLDRRR